MKEKHERNNKASLLGIIALKNRKSLHRHLTFVCSEKGLCYCLSLRASYFPQIQSLDWPGLADNAAIWLVGLTTAAEAQKEKKNQWCNTTLLCKQKVTWWGGREGSEPGIISPAQEACLNASCFCNYALVCLHYLGLSTWKVTVCSTGLC